MNGSGILGMLDGKQFLCGRLTLGCAWRFDLDEFVIRSTGTPEGTERAVVVFDEDTFSDLVEERLTTKLNEESLSQLAPIVCEIYSSAKHLGAKEIRMEPDYREPA